MSPKATPALLLRLGGSAAAALAPMPNTLDSHRRPPDCSVGALATCRAKMGRERSGADPVVRPPSPNCRY
jgi:hypothetical protein